MKKLWRQKSLLVMSFLGILCFLGIPVKAQELTSIERLLEANDITYSEESYEEIIHTLEYLAEHPLNLNTAGADSLKQLFFLSDMQIDYLLNFRKTHNGFRHLNELLLVPGFHATDVQNIRPFVFIGKQSLPANHSRYNKTHYTLFSRVKTTYPLQAGYDRYSPEAFLSDEDYREKIKNRFQGPPWGTLLKYKLESDSRLQAAITLENDAGEPYFTREQKQGFDFLSAHLQWKGEKLIQQWVIGDYKLQFGQGLVAWQGFSAGNSTSPGGDEKSARLIIPNTSTDENRYLRGMALILRPFPRWTTTIFLSSKRTDGNIQERDTLDPEDVTTASLLETGYHRNAKELSKKHTLKERTAGLSVNLNHDRFHLGVHSLYYNFSPRLSTGKRVYQTFNDDGRQRFLYSMDYKTRFKGFYLFGETACSERGAWATVNGLRYTSWSRAALGLLYRRYDKRYTSHYSGGVGKYSNTSNEEGICVNLETTLLPRTRFMAYYDRFRFFSPRYQATLPGNGSEFRGELVYHVHRHEISLYFKQSNKPEDIRTGDRIQQGKNQKEEWRLQALFRPGNRFSFRSRFALSRYHKGEKREKGFLGYGDVNYTSPRQNFTAQFRLAYFHTDSYNSRLYAYEHNVLHGYSFPAYYDRGIRSYLNLNWKPYPFLTFYAKGGIIYYPDKAYISSSLPQVESNHLFDLTLQIRLRF